MDRFGFGVWSEVEIVNDRGSCFKGVVLPRSETSDEFHIVVKLFNGYNVGVEAGRIATAKETRLSQGRLQDSGEGISRSTPARRASRCWAPAARSPRGSTTAPAR